MEQAQQNRRVVLIVEDDAELRGLTAKLLEGCELDTIECDSAEAALAMMLIRGRDIAMIFADIRLPGVMDGSTWRARSGCAGPFFLSFLRPDIRATTSCRLGSILCPNRGSRSISLWPLSRR